MGVRSHLGPLAAVLGLILTAAVEPPPLRAASRQEALNATATEARDALLRRDYETARRLYARLVATVPGHPGVYAGLAASQHALGRRRAALETVLSGLARHPEHGQLNELLGDLEALRGRPEAAVAAYRLAAAAPAGNTRRLQDKMERLQREAGAVRTMVDRVSGHFLIRHDGQVDARLADEVLDFLHQELQELGRRLQHTPREPITVILHASRSFHATTMAPGWAGGLYDGRIHVPMAGLRSLDDGARDVLLHELTHAVVDAKARGNCPRWLQEGMALLMEGHTTGSSGREEIAAVLATGPVETWETRGFSYAVSLAIVEHLEERHGFHGLVRLLDLLGSGQDVDAALTRLDGRDYTALLRHWARRTAG